MSRTLCRLQICKKQSGSATPFMYTLTGCMYPLTICTGTYLAAEVAQSESLVEGVINKDGRLEHHYEITDSQVHHKNI